MLSKQPITVTIADGHALYRDGLRQLLQGTKGIRLLGEAADGRALIGLVKKQRPSVVITEMDLPGMNALAVIQQIKLFSNNNKILVLTESDDEALISNAITAGANGYVMKTCVKATIVKAIRTVGSGNAFYYTPARAGYRSSHFVTAEERARRINKARLNAKETNMLQLICSEKTTKEIGEAIQISGRTLERVRTRLINKLDVKNTAGLVLYAIRNGLYKID